MARKTAKYKTEFDKVERLYEVIGGLVEKMGGLIWMDIWTLDIGHWTLDIGHWTLDIRNETLDIGHWTEGNGAEEVRPGKLLFFMGIANARLFARQTVEKKLSVCLYPY